MLLRASQSLHVFLGFAQSHTRGLLLDRFSGASQLGSHVSRGVVGEHTLEDLEVFLRPQPFGEFLLGHCVTPFYYVRNVVKDNLN